MDLQSGPLLALCVLLAIAAPAVCLVLWNRLTGPLLVRVAERLGLIILCQVTVLALAGLLVNHAFQLFPSWSDLTGTDKVNGQVKQASGTPPKEVRPGPVFTFDKSLGLFGATVDGQRSGIQSTIRVWLPPQYDLPQYAHMRFPVIELFPGFPGTPTTWFGPMQGAAKLLETMKAGQAKPYILVAPVITVEPGRDTECTDIPHGPQVATWLTADVREAVIGRFRALPGAESWGAMGYSTGGFCAAKLTEQFPNLFSAGISLAGYFDPSSPDITRDPVLTAANSPQALLASGPQVSLLLAGSSADSNTVDVINAMVKAARPPTKVFTYIVQNGGHNVRVWQEMLPQAYDWMSRQLIGPA
jgi:enterochelin esterase-like enzyme